MQRTEKVLADRSSLWENLTLKSNFREKLTYDLKIKSINLKK